MPLVRTDIIARTGSKSTGETVPVDEVHPFAAFMADAASVLQKRLVKTHPKLSHEGRIIVEAVAEPGHRFDSFAGQVAHGCHHPLHTWHGKTIK